VKNILVDTQIFLWAITGDPRLSNPHREAYLEAGHELYLSLASVWEMLIDGLHYRNDSPMGGCGKLRSL
jgi:PIN domain nuclease of toxin-antitoxin system